VHVIYSVQGLYAGATYHCRKAVNSLSFTWFTLLPMWPQLHSHSVMWSVVFLTKLGLCYNVAGYIWSLMGTKLKSKFIKMSAGKRNFLKSNQTNFHYQYCPLVNLRLPCIWQIIITKAPRVIWIGILESYLFKFSKNLLQRYGILLSDLGVPG
jgi:hypothetical protein